MMARTIKCLCSERDRQQWGPVLRPIALYIIEERMIFSPNRSHPRVKREGMLWRIVH
jgi:hypothetical protein